MSGADNDRILQQLRKDVPRILLARGLTQEEIDGLPWAKQMDYAVDPAWRPEKPNGAAPPPKANGHAPENETPPADSAGGPSPFEAFHGEAERGDGDELPELPPAICDGIDRWHRLMCGRKGSAADILRMAAHDLFALLKVSPTVYPLLQDAAHQAVVDALQEIAEVGDIPDDTAQKIMREGRCAVDQGGANNPEDGDPPRSDEDPNDDVPDAIGDDEQIKAARKEIKEKLYAAIDEMNRKYMVVNDNGTGVIFMDRYDDLLGRRIYDRMKKTSFLLIYANDTICTGISAAGKRTYKPLPQVWLTHKRRRNYKDGVKFDSTTTESKDGYLNLWRGFEFVPQPGSWAKMKNHMLNVVCGGEEAYFNYLIGWMAHTVQFPAKQGEVAIVMRGGRGVGKGIVAHAMRKIFGQHGMYISQSKHLVGNFNSHLRDCVLLFADEAFFAGDKQSEGALKALITEETLTVEPKGVDVFLSKNRLHIMMASNENWVVPAGLDERRFFVLDVAGIKQGDLPYFKAVMREMEDGGYAAMLHDLLKYDLGDYDIRHVPGTAALDEQKKLSLSHENQWWLDVLSRGYVYRSRFGLESYFGQWHDLVSTEVLYDSYLDYAKARNIRYPVAKETIGRFMGAMGCKPGRQRGDGGVIGEHQVRSEFDGVLRPDLIRKDRAPGYRLGTLDEARQAFEAYTKLPFDWDADEEST
jgi:hypothetical protein